MKSRRQFLGLLAGSVGASLAYRASAQTAGPKSPLKGYIGIQLYSLRNHLPKDLDATLARVRSWGLGEVEGAGLWGLSPAKLKESLDRAGLVQSAGHYGLDRFEKDFASIAAEARVLGMKSVGCPWLPLTEGKLTFDDARKYAEAFNRFGKAAKDEGLRFFYHVHGHEFAPGPDGKTVFDLIAAQTDPALVTFEIDVYWTRAGGADPAKIIAALPGRVPFLHLKEMKKGIDPASKEAWSGDSEVAVGSGQLDWTAILKAANAAGTVGAYIEDESPRVLEQVPASLGYLSKLML